MNAFKIIEPLQIYLGPGNSADRTFEWVKKNRLHERYQLEFDVSSETIAKYLSEGNVIGRCAGRMEFGQRALGNRSILADPRNVNMIRKINDKIKNRDFWIPFAPTIIREDSSRYLVNPKKLKAPFMTIAFDSTEEARRDLAAALHPVDCTLRPQVLDQQSNPEYYKILSAFKKMTGVGGLLNTLFNLHGGPIVCSNDEALHVFDNSDMICFC